MLSTLAYFVIGFPILASAAIFEPRAIQTNATCGPDFGWMSNSGGLTPCQLSAHLMAACLQGDYIVPALQKGNHYNPPNSQENTINRCSCSWATYNLFSACTACQGLTESISRWVAWQANCAGQLSTTYWPNGVPTPSNVRIPSYAGTNASQWNDGTFNIEQAKNISDLHKPDLGTTELTTSPSASPTSNKTPVGAIVGGVVGGLVVLVAGLGLAWWIMRRRRARQGVQELRHSPSFHTRSFSDITQKTMGPSVGYTSFTTFGGQTSASPPPVSPTIYTHNDSHHSVSHFGSISAYTTPHQGTPSRHVTSPAPTTQTFAREDIVQPFTISRSQTPQPRKGDEVVLDPYNRMPGVNRAEDTEDSASEVSSGRRARMNPPAYTPHPSPSESSHDVASARRERQGHGHRPYPREKGSQDTQTTASPWTSVGSRGVSDTTIAPVAPGSLGMEIMNATSGNVPGARSYGEFGQLRSAPAPGPTAGNRPRPTRSVISDDQDDSVEIA
ncbi:hypothetical protein VNI00_017980 [Paramarasmius palmivorus]|uniref:Uncharacterized protein n=1 Tax=Paramarasmius palmivorus TaxID=297713 RepID=A0AAW0B4E6_9AGAR